MHIATPTPSTPKHEYPSTSLPRRSSHVRKSSLTLFKIAASASGNRLAPHSPISPPRGEAKGRDSSFSSSSPSPSPSPSPSRKDHQRQSELSSTSHRRFSFAFGASSKGPATGPSRSHGPAEEQSQQSVAPVDTATEAIRCHVVADDDVLLPFLQRAVEVRELLFSSSHNATLASRLRSWASIRGAIGDDVLHTLTNVDRSELDDARWVATLRSVLIKEVPDLWADLALTLGADGSSFVLRDPQVKSYQICDSYDDDAIDDASDLSTLPALPHQGGNRTRKHSRSLSAFSTVSFEVPDRSVEGRDAGQEASTLEVEGLRYLPAGYSVAIAQLQEPTFASSEEEEPAQPDAEDGGHIDTPMPGSQVDGSSSKSPGYFHGLSSDGVASVQGRSRSMSVSLSAQQTPVYSGSDRRLASESFAGLRLQASAFDDNSRMAESKESSPDLLRTRRASKTVRSENQPLTLQHSRKLSDLVGNQQGTELTAVKLPSKPPALETPRIGTINEPLSNVRPTAATPSLDDEELLHPQKSKISFARNFEGPTPSDPRHHGRPKAYSMTQYSSHVEQERLEEGRIASITPYEAAAAFEASGVDKPADLGVLKDGSGRTRHPSSGRTESASLVGAFRASLGLSPGSSSLSPINSNPSSGDGSSANGDSGTATPVTKDSLSTLAPGKSIPSSHASDASEGTAGSSRSVDVSRTKHTQDVQQPSTRSLTGSRSIQAALDTPPRVHRRPGGFDSFSAELMASQRSRAKSDAAFSSGSQAVASSSEGSALSDFGLSTKAEEQGEEEIAVASPPPPAAASSIRGPVSAGEFGLDFGDQQEENVAARFGTPKPSATVPATPPSSKSVRRSPLQTSSPRSPRNVKGDDHIIIPIPPGGPRSRAQAMFALWKRSDVQDLVETITSGVGQKRWNKALELMCTVERDTSTDLALLETLATDCFDLLDLDCVDETGREEAELLMCGETCEEDQDGYSKRWKAFEVLLNDGLCVPSSTLQEAKRRCALHL